MPHCYCILLLYWYYIGIGTIFKKIKIKFVYTKSKGFGDNHGGRFLSVCTFHFKCFHLHTSVEHVVKISRPIYYDVYNTHITDAVISSTSYIFGVHTN